MNKKRLAIISLLSLVLITSTVIAITHHNKIEKTKRQKEESQKAIANEFCKTENIDQLFVGCNDFF